MNKNLIVKNRCEWSFNRIAPTNFMLRQYDAIDDISILNLFRLQSYTF